jgi:hypothetical protein
MSCVRDACEQGRKSCNRPECINAGRPSTAFLVIFYLCCAAIVLLVPLTQ